MKKFLKKICFFLFDILVFPLTIIYLPLVLILKKYGIYRFPLTISTYLRLGLYPIRNHYYEPQFKFSPDFDPGKIRKLSLKLNPSEQLSRLQNFAFTEELSGFLQNKPDNELQYYIQNGSFEQGDSDLYYLMIRNIKPKRIIEIGSGYTTLICMEAIRKNQEEGHETELICIEPYERPWLSSLKNITVIRKRVEELSPSFFYTLEENDFLFIDSSHIIRPENDVLFEYFELLPSIKPGVIIHIHDIFTPRHYPRKWLLKEQRLWNEQYLLEAFLHYNQSFEILFTLNHLKNDFFEEVAAILTNITAESEPASFWMRKVG